MRIRAVRLSCGRLIGPGQPTYVVAEIGQNHNGNLAWAEQLVDAAAWAGADAVKFVKRDLEWELSRSAWLGPYQSEHAFGTTYGEHRRALELSAEDHRRLRERAAGHGLRYFSTVCDLPSIELMETLGVDLFKIASRDLENLPLIEAVARRGLPVIVSTGMSALEQIDAAVGVLRRHRARFLLLQCTSLYPTPPEQVHLRSMATLAERYHVPVGYSDHTLGTHVAPAAAALGAVLVEKHLTLDRTAKGTDHACSLEPGEFAQLVQQIRLVERALGEPRKPVAGGVNEVRQRLGRSLVTRVELQEGEMVDESMLALKCPGNGLGWEQRGQIVGRAARRSIAANEQLNPADFT